MWGVACSAAGVSVPSSTIDSASDIEVVAYRLNFTALSLGPSNLSRSHFALFRPDGDGPARDDFLHARSRITQHQGLARTEPNDLSGMDIIHQFQALKIAG